VAVGEKVVLEEYSKKASGDQPEENKDGKRKTKTS